LQRLSEPVIADQFATGTTTYCSPNAMLDRGCRETHMTIGEQNIHPIVVVTASGPCTDLEPGAV